MCVVFNFIIKYVCFNDNKNIFSGVSYQMVRTAEKKRNSAGKVQEVIQDDQRGKHHNNPFKVPDQNLAAVLQHIDSYPIMESHYCREKTNRRYLEEGLSLHTMYRMYEKDVILKNRDFHVSEYMYRQIFNTQRNLGFFAPKKDRCVYSRVLPT